MTGWFPILLRKDLHPFVADDGRFSLVWCGYLNETWFRGFGIEKSDLGWARKYKMKYSSAEDVALLFFKINFVTVRH